jgi:hypothetical protein
MKFLITHLFQASYYFTSLGSKYFPQHPVLKHLHTMSFLNTGDQISRPYNTAGKIIIHQLIKINVYHQFTMHTFNARFQIHSAVPKIETVEKQKMHVVQAFTYFEDMITP